MVEEIVEYGRPYHYGLEAGSKPELLAVMAMLDDEDALIVCNGYKDEEYIETALLALASSAARSIIVVEKLVRAAADRRASRRRLGVRPRIGIRVKLSTQAAPGAGRRRAATAPSSACRRARCSRPSTFLRENDLLDCFELLHFHLGSQISAIRAVKNALREAGRVLRRAGKHGRAAQVPRRGRRPGRRLRRLADQLRARR